MRLYQSAKRRSHATARRWFRRTLDAASPSDIGTDLLHDAVDRDGATTTTRFYCWCQDRGALARSRSSTPSLSSLALRPSPSPPRRAPPNHDDDRALSTHTTAPVARLHFTRALAAHTLYHHAHNRTTRTRPVPPVPRPGASSPRRAMPRPPTALDAASVALARALNAELNAGPRRRSTTRAPDASTGSTDEETAKKVSREYRHSWPVTKVRVRSGGYPPTTTRERGWKRARRRRNARVVESTRVGREKTSRARDDADGDDGARAARRERRDCERTR